MVSLTFLRQKHEFKVFIFLMDETEMAQNNPLFVWKTSNYSRGRSNLRLCDTYFSGFFDVAFDPHISSIVRLVVDHVAKLVFFVPVAEVDNSPTPTLRSSLRSPLPLPPLILGNSPPNSCVTDGCWFSFISHFAVFTKSINDCTISFGAFSLFIILEQCTGNRLPLLS